MPGDALSESVSLELEGLKAIYGEHSVKWTTSSCSEASAASGTLTISVDSECGEIECDDYHDGQRNQQRRIEIEFVLPSDYPKSQPRCSINAPMLSTQQLREIASAAINCGSTLGQECLFSVIEEIRERVSTLETRNDGSINTVDPDQCLETSSILSNTTGIAKSTIQIISGGVIVDRKSVFQAHVAAVSSKDDVDEVVSTLKQNPKVGKATHNIVAYRLRCHRNGIPLDEVASIPMSNKRKKPHKEKEKQVTKNKPIEDFIILQDHDSDGEAAAGGRLQHLLGILEVSNVVVVVSRWYGGIPLGPDRFRHINNAARELLVETGIGRREIEKHSSK